MPEAVWLLLLAATVLAGILSGAPVMAMLAGVPLLVASIAAVFGAFDPTFLLALPQRIYGIMENPVLIAVPLFVAMGVLLEKSNAAERMMIGLSGLLGGSAGMLLISVLAVSALVAASTGIIGATVVMLVMIALPALLRSGLPPGLSSGLVCASGTLGQIIPPSIVLVLLGDQISAAHVEAQRSIGRFAVEPVTVGDLFAGALLPGLLLVVLYAGYCLIVIGLPRTPASNLSAPPIAETSASLTALAADFLPVLLLIVVVLGSILFGIATPTEAAALGVGGTLLLAAARTGEQTKTGSFIQALAVAAALGLAALKLVDGGAANILSAGLAALLAGGLAVSLLRLWRVGILQAVLSETVLVTAMIFGIVIAATILTLVVRGFGGDQIVRDGLAALPGGKWGMLAGTMLVIFLLGFVLEFVEIVFIVVPVAAPALLAAGIDPVWLAVLIAINLQTSFLTPPFGFALFYFRSVAPPSISTVTLYRSIAPFVLLQILALLIVLVFPPLATWLPSALSAP